MNKPLCYTTIILIVITAFLLTLNREAIFTNSGEIIDTQTVNITSLDELNKLFNKLQYTTENWKDSDRDIPRIIIDKVNENWPNTSSALPVTTKKSIFFRLMMPLILVANENILREREIVQNASLDSKHLTDLAFKYTVIKEPQAKLTQADRHTLLTRVDTFPTSVALAQAAEESGWATSRFALQGNAFFGLWDFTGNGMKPKQQRQELGNYGVARFDNPLASVEAYMLNINTHQAYSQLRLLRAQKRSNNERITGNQFASKLDKYSERGQAYVQGIQQIIRYNNLESTDGLSLDNSKEIHLFTAIRP
ncbi:MAG: glucosaminidase domain-containing protein [Psychromonas sp.]